MSIERTAAITWGTVFGLICYGILTNLGMGFKTIELFNLVRIPSELLYSLIAFGVGYVSGMLRREYLHLVVAFPFYWTFAYILIGFKDKEPHPFAGAVPLFILAVFLAFLFALPVLIKGKPI